MPETQPTTLPEGRRPVPAPASGADTVTVACKIPNGLILRVFDLMDLEEGVFGGGTRTVKNGQSIQVGDQVVVRGSSLDLERLRGGKLPNYPHVGGYALTHGVSKEFWDRWVVENKSHPAVLNGLIFAEPSVNRAMSAADERKDTVSGMEGIDPADPAKKTGIRAIAPGERPKR